MTKEDNLAEKNGREYRQKRRNVLDMEDIWCEKETENEKKMPWTQRTQADKEKEEFNWRTVCDRHTKRNVNIQYNTSKVKVHLL